MNSSLLTRIRTFTSSSIRQESKRKRVARLKKKANLAKRENQLIEQERTRPDPLLGYNQKFHQHLWDSCKLKSLLLDPKEVWQSSADNTTSPDQMFSNQLTEKPYDRPQLLNFGLNAEDAQLLFDELPKVSATQLPMMQMPLSEKKGTSLRTEDLEKDHQQAKEVEEEKKDQLMRILDLRNASARGIAAENQRRIIEAFGRTKDQRVDSGSTEVQVALLTAKIHNLRSHLLQAPKDHPNQRKAMFMVAQRAKLLRYLKRVSLERYLSVLKDCGLEARAVEGEQVITQADFRALRTATA